ncbi:MAG TPA: CDP-glycerol glycerophosphotransferase family protein [Chlamydiales bacterium]|nr:CDP-glycerol glycerophosphotransferase family protein [Chlamydiales bacterium]
MRCAAFNTGTEFHMLDHIAPLAELMQMPLITTEEQNTDLARRYYPQVEVRYLPDLEFRLGEIAEQFDALFECKFWGADLKSLFHHLYRKEMRLIFCPHGQSDKGIHSLAQYPLQDIVLIYGDLMIEMLKDLKLSISNYALVGNYRLQFYRKYQSFYDQLAEEEIFSKLHRNKRTLLYAPTWKDGNQSTSFFNYGPSILSQLPDDWNLIIKLHPLLEQRDPAHFYSIAALADRKPNALLVNEFPPVYPLLSRADAYLGDFSSVGYDYLAFQRPLFFLPTPHPGRLHACGHTIDPATNIYTQLDRDCDREKQKKLYHFAFGKEILARDAIRKVITRSEPAK